MLTLTKSLSRIGATAVLAAASLFGVSAHATDITGAGSSFVYPVLSKWSAAYAEKTGNKLNYQSVGSGAGVAQIKEGTIDFGATDAPVKAEDLAQFGLGQFPVVVGGIVPVVNIPGVEAGQVKLDGTTLADIFLGKITMWNDPRIAAMNAGVNLPSKKITVVHRSDGSGTSFNFTNYLSKVSTDWASKVKFGTAVEWPTGVGGKGNEGVSQYVQRLPNSIGYVESAYADQNKMDYVSLKNRAGAFVEPDASTFQAAAAGADWSTSFYQVLTDEPGKNAWPITGATFVLVHKVQDKPAQGAATLKFFDWAYVNGDKAASELDYIVLPDAVKAMVRKEWASVKDGSGNAIAMK